ncbi:hypothetical protein RF11_15162 [Thelohanellus kitauei]|uniref:Peptidase A2 domain-containing protein n=1 Tax=Thelohanellus kitauei TaxID=669202 RepID=A0A0C2J8V3_THEKT|nr:hypothetical protein RF11_15162 [Thelohanellus kitauei]
MHRMVEVESPMENKQINVNDNFDNYLPVIIINQIFPASFNKGSILISLLIQEIFVWVNVDSGAAVSSVDKHFWKKKGLPMLRHCQTLTGYMGSIISTIGVTTVKVEHDKNIFNLPLYVVVGNNVPLLGLDWMHSLNISVAFPKPQINIYNIISLHSVLKNYHHLFSRKLGNIKEYETIIQLSQNSKPDIWNPRPVPSAIKDKIEQELDRLLI